MAWYEENSWLTMAFGPNLSTIVVTLLIALTLPVLVHWYLYRSSTLTNVPTFLLLGPSGAGKTTLATKVI
jgi:signal recognition particle receptor subunit beta